MTTTFEIPLTPEPQIFTINIVGVTYKMSLLWNYVSNNWNLDMLLADNTPFIRGIPLVANTNLFEQYNYLNIGGQLIARTDNDGPDDINPTFDNLGKTSHLYFIII